MLKKTAEGLVKCLVQKTTVVFNLQSKKVQDRTILDYVYYSRKRKQKKNEIQM